MNFTDYARSQGCELLKDDLNFIKQRIEGLPLASKITLTRRFVDEWRKGMAECQNPVKRQNEGRRAASIFLRTATSGQSNPR